MTAASIVTYTGPGIPAERCEPVCEGFWRADRSRSRQVGGSGLGQSIVRSSRRRTADR